MFLAIVLLSTAELRLALDGTGGGGGRPADEPPQSQQAQRGLLHEQAGLEAVRLKVLLGQAAAALDLVLLQVVDLVHTLDEALGAQGCRNRQRGLALRRRHRRPDRCGRGASQVGRGKGASLRLWLRCRQATDRLELLGGARQDLTP